MWKQIDTANDQEVREAIRIMHGMGTSWKAATLGNVRWWLSIHKCELYRYSNKSLNLILGFQWDEVHEQWHIIAAGITGVATTKEIVDLFVDKSAEFARVHRGKGLIAVVPKRPEYPFAFAFRKEVQHNARVNWKEEFQTHKIICYELSFRG